MAFPVKFAVSHITKNQTALIQKHSAKTITLFANAVAT